MSQVFDPKKRLKDQIIRKDDWGKNDYQKYQVPISCQKVEFEPLSVGDQTVIILLSRKDDLILSGQDLLIVSDYFFTLQTETGEILRDNIQMNQIEKVLRAIANGLEH